MSVDWSGKFHFIPGCKLLIPQGTTDLWCDVKQKHFSLSPEANNFKVGIHHILSGEAGTIVQFSGIVYQIISSEGESTQELSSEEASAFLQKMNRRFKVARPLGLQEDAPNGALKVDHWVMEHSCIRWKETALTEVTPIDPRPPEQKILVQAKAELKKLIPGENAQKNAQRVFVISNLEKALEELKSQKSSKEFLGDKLFELFSKRIEANRVFKETITYSDFFDLVSRLDLNLSNGSALVEDFNGSWRADETRELQRFQISNTDTAAVFNMFQKFLTQDGIQELLADYLDDLQKFNTVGFSMFSPERFYSVPKSLLAPSCLASSLYCDRGLQSIRLDPEKGDYQLGVTGMNLKNEGCEVRFSGVVKIMTLIEGKIIGVSVRDEDALTVLGELVTRLTRVDIEESSTSAKTGKTARHVRWADQCQKPLEDFCSIFSREKEERVFKNKIRGISEKKAELLSWTEEQYDFITKLLEKSLRQIVEEKYLVLDLSAHEKLGAVEKLGDEKKVKDFLVQRLLEMLLPDTKGKSLPDDVEALRVSKSSILHEDFLESKSDFLPESSTITSLQMAYEDGSWKSGESRTVEYWEISKVLVSRALSGSLQQFLNMPDVQRCIYAYIRHLQQLIYPT